MIIEDEVNSEIFDIVKKALIHQPIKLTNNTNLIKVGALDSLGVMDVSQTISKRYQITIENIDINPHNFSTISGIVKLVNRYL